MTGTGRVLASESPNYTSRPAALAPDPPAPAPTAAAAATGGSVRDLKAPPPIHLERARLVAGPPVLQ